MLYEFFWSDVGGSLFIVVGRYRGGESKGSCFFKVFGCEGGVLRGRLVDGDLGWREGKICF